MRKFKFEQVNSTPYQGLDGTVILGDGTDTTHHILVEKVEGLGIPTSIVQKQQAPFQVGASPIRTTYGPRTITLECAIVIDCHDTAGKAAMELVKRDLGKKFSPVGMGYVQDTSLSTSNYSTVTGKLSYSADGGAYDRFIDCVPVSCEFPDRTYSDGFQRFRLVLECDDPTWYDAEQTATMANVSVGLSGTWLSVAWSSRLKLFCAVSNGSDIQTSPDGITWTLQTGANSGNWSAVAWSETLGIFCAVKNASGDVQTSPDGITWTLRTGISGSWQDIAWSEEKGIFVAISNSSTNIQTSPDGINWTLRTGAGSVSWSKITWAGSIGLFCVVAQSSASIQTSPDGINWTLRTGVGSANWQGIAWSQELGIFCAISLGSTSIQTSLDGITWTSRTGASGANWCSIAWSSKLMLFCAVSSNSGDIQTSPDGITWTLRTGISGSWLSVTWAPEIGAFCAVPSAVLNYPEISYDGINWVQNSATTDWSATVNNQGDVPASFEISVPIAGNETGKVIVIGEDFLWAGAGTPPTDHNLVFGTDGLKVGTVEISTHFNNKDITQFGISKFNLYQKGTFFSLFVSGNMTNKIYLRNTGTASTAPTITWKNRYLGV